MALISAKARVAAIEIALDQILASFKKFHDFVLDFDDRSIPSELIFQLSKTAMEVATISQDATKHSRNGDRDSEDHYDCEKSPYRSSFEALEDVEEADEIIVSERASSMKGTAGTVAGVSRSGVGSPHLSPQAYISTSKLEQNSIAHRLLGACLERAYAMLSLAENGSEPLLPALALPLKMERPERLLGLCLALLSSPHDYGRDVQYSSPIARILPKMYRVIEGLENAPIPRLPPPYLTRLVFGKTRTRLLTDIPDLQGEWLEAADVEEYLEERGIYIRAGSPSSDVLELAIPSMCRDSSPPKETENFDPISAQCGTLFSSQAEIGGISSKSRAPGAQARHRQNRRITEKMHSQWAEAGIDVTTFDVGSDYTIFGRSNGPSGNIPSGFYTFTPSLSSQQPNIATPPAETHTLTASATSFRSNQSSKVTKITISLDKLVKSLAATAVCLGPVPGIRRDDVDLAIRESIVSS
jgi:hypothetical protein